MPFNNITNYLKEVKVEMTKVTWPTRSDTIKWVLTVVIVSVLVGLFIVLLDYSLTKLFEIILERSR
ncbi:MAG: preprotein translocase subunit SecE [Candidatus Woykebacteria bacterium RBG_13_40_7b]|uniref:Protein translocase subunit SecE n=1 Tax=Candidatus Woykebacteria bacterium RBG_13_40_7b TaxID=1802594 RepID=A0A1G1W9Z4_9BACT|nr:MAG: preprotein translocase subunit SecE [Candidatus Woykebacteria bacterium RBG_13_40_7b]